MENMLLDLRDIWIPISLEIDQHHVRFYLPRMENMFKIGDKVVRVEHFRTVSKMYGLGLI
jgi:hypothetical protein